MVNLVHFAVANAKRSSNIVVAAKNVEQHHAFAALVVAIYASIVGAGVQKSFRISCDVQSFITRISKSYGSSTFQSTQRRSSHSQMSSNNNRLTKELL
jgi:urease accessory protein UreF